MERSRFVPEEFRAAVAGFAKRRVSAQARRKMNKNFALVILGALALLGMGHLYGWLQGKTTMVNCEEVRDFVYESCTSTFCNGKPCDGCDDMITEEHLCWP